MPNFIDLDEHLPLKVASEQYGVSRPTLYKWILNGWIHPIKTFRGNTFINVHELKRVSEKRKALREK